MLCKAYKPLTVLSQLGNLRVSKGKEKIEREKKMMLLQA